MITEADVIQYLKDQIKEGHTYFKAKHIAKDIGDRPKRVGAILSKLAREGVPDIKITSWSWSLSTTWRVVKT